MPAKNDRVVSIRVPEGLPEELKAYTGVPFSTLMRTVAITLRNNEREKQRKAKESHDGADRS